MKILKCFAMTIRVLPMLMAGIALVAATDGAFAKNAARPGTAVAGGGGTAGIVTGPAPGRPIEKPLPPIPVDHGKGDGRVAHDGSSDHKYSSRHEGGHRYDYRRHKHSRYESPPIIGKNPGRESRRSDLFRRGVVGPRI